MKKLLKLIITTCMLVTCFTVNVFAESPTYSALYDDADGAAIEVNGSKIGEDSTPYDGDVTFKFTPPGGGTIYRVDIEVFKEESEFYSTSFEDEHKIVIDDNEFTFNGGSYSYQIVAWWSEESCDYDMFWKPYMIEYETGDGGAVNADASYKKTYKNKTKLGWDEPPFSVSFNPVPADGKCLDSVWIEQEAGGDDDYNALKNSDSAYQNNVLNYSNFSSEGFAYMRFGFETSRENIEVKFPETVTIDDNKVTYYDVDGNSTNVTITVVGAEVDSTNKNVIIPKSNLRSVTFTVDDNFNSTNMDLRIMRDQVILPLDNKATDLYNVTETIDDSVELNIWYFNGTSYTISYGDSQSIEQENGKVEVERIRFNEKTYTNINDEIDESNNVFSMDKIKGDKALTDFNIEYKDNEDVFISTGSEGASIDFKFTPNYGYQVTDVVINETFSILKDFNPAVTTVSEFTYNAKRNTNIHFTVVFSKVDDITNVTAATVNSASISNGENAAINGGNLDLKIADTDLDTSIENAVNTFDLSLNNVVSKGGSNGEWEKNITSFDNPITLTLELDKDTYDGGNYTVVREHDGVKEVLSDTTYNETTGKLTFPTNKFSKYTIVEIPKPNYDSGSSGYVAPKTGIK